MTSSNKDHDETDEKIEDILDVVRPKRGNVWGNPQRVQELQEEYLQRKKEEVDTPKQKLLHFVLAAVGLTLVIIFLILQAEYDIWFF